VRKFIPARFVPGSAIDADGKRRIEFWLRMVFSALIDAWTNYFRQAACKRTLSRLVHFVWPRVIRWFRALHHWTWKGVRRRFTTPTDGGNRLRRTGSHDSTGLALPVFYDPAGVRAAVVHTGIEVLHAPIVKLLIVVGARDGGVCERAGCKREHRGEKGGADKPTHMCVTGRTGRRAGSHHGESPFAKRPWV
jgi:Group II intron, maturase-specific domain